MIIRNIHLGTFNIPKFFEFELTKDQRNGTIFTDYSPTIMNEDKNYITFSSWWDELIVTGIIPFLALVAFNSKIYVQLRASDKQEYRFVGKQKVEADIPTMTFTTVCVPSSDEDDISTACLPEVGDNLDNPQCRSLLTPNNQCKRDLSISAKTKPLLSPKGGQILLKHELLSSQNAFDIF